MYFKRFLTFLLPILRFGHWEPELSSSTPAQVKSVGETVNLECVFHNVNASEFPMSWLKETQDPHNSYQLLSRVFSFQIRDLRESDSGAYICNVHLSDATRLEGKVLLTVEPASDDKA